MKNVSCNISKQKMRQSPSHQQLQTLPSVHSEGTQDGKEQGTGPRQLRCIPKEWFQWAQTLASSPMHMNVCSVPQCVWLCNSMGCSPPGSCVNGILQARILEWVAMPSSRGLPNPGIKPRYPTVQADSLLSEPPGKPMNTGVGSLSHLQRILPTQELNRDLLHCRQILYTAELS